MRRQLVRILGPVLALGGGLAWSACFQADSRPLLACVAFAPLVALLGRPRAWLWGWLWGATAWLAMVPWIAPTISTFGGLSQWLAWPLLVLLCVVLGSEGALLAWLGAGAWRRSGTAAMWLLPSLWVLLELARGFFANGFPWNLAAYAWTDLPGALPLSSWIGAWGVSWCVVAVNVALALALVRGRWLTATAVLLSLATLLVVAGRFAGDDVALSWGRDVSVLQPDSPISFDPQQMWDDYERLLVMSDAECALGPRLLVWPESAAFPHSWTGSVRLRRDVGDLASRGCDVLLGSAMPAADGAGGVRNAALLVTADGVAGLYAKRRLVPFGEYVPFESVLPFVGTLAREAGRFEAGREPALLPWQGEELAMAICYEVVFPAAVAEQVRAGAGILVTITNDAWYGDSSAPWQHLRAARFRAAENRRPTLRAALTGVSALIDARGRVTAQLGVGAEGALRGKIKGLDGLSPFSRRPWLTPLVSLLLAAWGVARFGRISGHAAPAEAPGDAPTELSRDPST